MSVGALAWVLMPVHGLLSLSKMEHFYFFRMQALNICSKIRENLGRFIIGVYEKYVTCIYFPSVYVEFP